MQPTQHLAPHDAGPRGPGEMLLRGRNYAKEQEEERTWNESNVLHRALYSKVHGNGLKNKIKKHSQANSQVYEYNELCSGCSAVVDRRQCYLFRALSPLI